MEEPKIIKVDILLPERLRDQLDEKVQRFGSYTSISEYLCDLIRRDLQRDALAHVDQLLVDGLRSGTPIPVTKSWWKDRDHGALAPVWEHWADDMRTKTLQLSVRPRAQADLDELVPRLEKDIYDLHRLLAGFTETFNRLLDHPPPRRAWPTTHPDFIGVRREALFHHPVSVFYLRTKSTVDIVRIVQHRAIPQILHDLI